VILGGKGGRRDIKAGRIADRARQAIRVVVNHLNGQLKAGGSVQKATNDQEKNADAHKSGKHKLIKQWTTLVAKKQRGWEWRLSHMTVQELLM
jgi:hypothetical protein